MIVPGKMEVVKGYDDWTDWNGDWAPDWSAQWVSTSKGKDLKNAKGSKDGKSGKSRGSKGVKGKEGSGVAFDNGWGGKGGKEKGNEGREGREGKGRSKATIGNGKEGLPECQSVFVSCIRARSYQYFSALLIFCRREGDVQIYLTLSCKIGKNQEKKMNNVEKSQETHSWPTSCFDAGWSLQHLVQTGPMVSQVQFEHFFFVELAHPKVEVFHGISVFKCKSIAGTNT